MTSRLLCVGDIHLGRRPGHVPESLSDYGIHPHELTPVAAWRNVVARAIEENVDAVLLAGDVVESIEDRFEAYGHLENGVVQLTEAGISVCGVAGNHDVQALPRLADRIDGFCLIGRGGEWETVELDLPRSGPLRLVGWSFPRPHVRENPLASLCPVPDDDVPTIGLLHCDTTGKTSPYAPVHKRAFNDAPGAAWFFGHLHTADRLRGPRPIGQLGSLSGLDPSEHGVHGPWLIEVRGPKTVEVVGQLPLAPLRWEREVVSVDGIAPHADLPLEDALESLFIEAMERIHARVERTVGRTRAVGCRFMLEGRSQAHPAIRRLIAGGPKFELSKVQDGIVYFVERIEDRARGVLDLEDLARGDDPPALLARRLLALERGSPEAEALCARAKSELTRIEDNVALWGGLEPSDVDHRELLMSTGLQALEELFEQRNQRLGERVR